MERLSYVCVPVMNSMTVEGQILAHNESITAKMTRIGRTAVLLAAFLKTCRWIGGSGCAITFSSVISEFGRRTAGVQY